MNIIKVFKVIREILWPMLENEENEKALLDVDTQVKIKDGKTKEVFDYILKIYESENERRKTIEAKSSLFIGAISVISTIIMGITAGLINAKKIDFEITFLVLALFLLTIYLARTIWFSVKALERRNYQFLSVENFTKFENEKDYYENLILLTEKLLKRNQIVINSKVDSMVMAQEYFKRSICVIAIYMSIIFVIFIENSELNINFSNFFKRIICINLNSWNLVIIYTLISISLMLNYLSFKRKK